MPFPSASGVTLDPSTGMMSFTPTAVCLYFLVIRVDEYRQGVHIGFVDRNLQINVTALCNAVQPAFANLQPITLPGGLTADGITASAGDTVIRLFFSQQMQCGSAVPDDIRLTGPAGLPNPVVDILPLHCTNGNTDSMDVCLLEGLKPGVSWLYTKKGFDGNTLLSECGEEMAEFDSVAIWVPGVATGIGKVPQGDMILRVDPNPSDGRFRTRYLLPPGKAGLLAVYDPEMRKVVEVRLPEGSREQRIELPDAPDGLYRVMLTSEGNRATQNVAVMHGD